MKKNLFTLFLCLFLGISVSKADIADDNFCDKAVVNIKYIWDTPVYKFGKLKTVGISKEYGVKNAQLYQKVEKSLKYIFVPEKGKYCVSPVIDIEYGFKNNEVILSDDLIPGTCPYDVTKAHEEKHLQIAIDNMNKFKNFSFNELAIYPKYYSNLKDAENETNRVVKFMVMRIFNDLKADFYLKNMQLDSPQSYQAERSKCNEAEWP